MKVIHFDSGLGNQMLAYCEYLAMKREHPEEDCYIENIIYEIPEVESVTSQWNGYELEKVFDLHVPNIKDYFDSNSWEEIVRRYKESKFWEKNWNWPVYGTKIFEDYNLKLTNLRGDFEKKQDEIKKSFKYKIKSSKVYRILQKTAIFEIGRQIYKHATYRKGISDVENLFYKGTEDAYGGMRLAFMRKNNCIELIDSEIRSTFIFPKHIDDRNIILEKEIEACESVAVHVRRGDTLALGARYFTSGYFKRAVSYIKRHIQSPCFYIFCDPDSVEWCKRNYRQLGLNQRDKITFVDWNAGTENYRDMQLMSKCKHNIITTSSFGWWGAYLNCNPKKITISSEIEINTTNNL